MMKQTPQLTSKILNPATLTASGEMSAMRRVEACKGIFRGPQYFHTCPDQQKVQKRSSNREQNEENLAVETPPTSSQ
jgi:hypothetical protein